MSSVDMGLFSPPPLRGKRVLVTGAARGIGAALAERLHLRGAHVALMGLEADALAASAAKCGNAPWSESDVSDRGQVEASVASMVRELGGLDVVVANAGVAAQLPLLGGNPEVFERSLAVNVLGVYYTFRAAGPHVEHQGGYALAVSSLAAALHPPLLGAYCASKAAVEAMGNSLRIELASSGARVGVAYFAELDTDMTRRGFGTAAAAKIAKAGPFTSVAPLALGIDALEQVQREHPSIDTFAALVDARAARDGGERAVQWAEQALRASPSLLGLDKLLSAKAALLEAGERTEIELAQQLIQAQARRLSRYVCSNCGFKASRFYWQCPGCNRWDTYSPKRSEELERG